MRFPARLFLTVFSLATLAALAGLPWRQPTGPVPPAARAPMPPALPAVAVAAPAVPAAALPAVSLPAATSASESTALRDFRGWSEAAAGGQPADPAQGLALARARRQAMAELIARDPERALAEAVPPLVRQRLPAEIVAQLEEPVSARGSLRVVAALPDGPQSSAGVRREVVLANGATYAASVYGSRLRQPTSGNVPLRGIALDGRLAVAESPVRLLAKGERIAPSTPVEFSCPVSGNTVPEARPDEVAAEELAAEIGGTVHFFCNAGHLAELTNKLQAEVENAAVPDSAYNQGVKRILLVRLNFTDDTAEPITAAGGQTLLTAVDTFINENSYGTCRIDLVNSLVTPVLVTMPKTKAQYVTENNSISFLADARTAATAAGYNYLNYDFEWFRYASIYGFGGQAYVGARGVWLQSSSTGVAAHEWGHNLGLWHANRWNTTNDSIIGTGTNVEYGDTYDTMGSAAAGKNSFNTCHRNLLGWLPDANVLTATTSGTYRIHAFDQTTLGALPLALRTLKEGNRFYWLEHRVQWGTSPTATNGVLVHWSPWASSNGGSQLLDLTPNTAGGTGDAALVVGRTFSDPYAGVHITPIARNAGTTPPSVDVVIQRGTFPGNRPPVLSPLNASATSVAVNATVNFTAAASDPDGDTLAYWWDFSNTAVGPNSASASTSWSSAGHYVVRCTVSDMKGRTAVRSILVTVGTPTTFTASGRVLDDYGQPVAGVRVHNGLTGGTYRGNYTDDDGRYTLTGLAAGSYTLGAVAGNFTAAATAGFTNPVTVGPSQSNLDFTGTSLGPVITHFAPSAGAREAGNVPATFTFQRGPEAPASRALTISYTLSGTADKATDYTVAAVPPATGTYTPATGAGTITLPLGATSADLRITPTSDTTAEGAENVILTLAAGTGYQVSGTTAVACVIADDDAADAYTETFAGAATTLRPFDLNGRRLTFTPTSATAYSATNDPAAAFPVNPVNGTVLATAGAASVALTSGSLTGGYWQLTGLTTQPKIFGQTFSTIFVNTNGNVSFGSGDSGAPSGTSTHFVNGRRRVTLFGAFFDLRRGGTVSWQTASSPARVVITYQNVPISGTGPAVLNAQVELGADGVISLTWLGTSMTDGLVGLAGGTVAPSPFYNTDLSAYGPTPIGYNAWLASRFTAAELNNPSISGPNADPDGDGWENFWEFVLGSDPRAIGAPAGAPAMGQSGGYATLTFRRDAQLGEVTYAVEASSDLGASWTEIARSVGGAATVAAPGQSPSSIQESAAGGSALNVTVGDTTLMNATSRRFLRLRAFKP